MKIEKDAIFIADVHFSKYRNLNFLDLLKSFEKSPPKQVFLLGDIFETLFGEVQYTIEQNNKIIQKLENLAQKSEIFYFEGNHDFNLKQLFKFVKIIPISQQPFSATFENKRVLLAHGDWNENFGYNIYRRIIEKSFVLKLISFLDFKNRFIQKIEKKQLSKEKCRKKDKFRDLIEKKISHLDFDIFIEAHYHQDEKFKFENQIYITIPPFLCKKKVKTFHELINSIS
jgi:UDP-2,3-diacylglucosamine hydrolase